jgi:hypothetical protein
VGNVSAVLIKANAGKTHGAISNIRYAGSATIPQTAGTYAVTFDVVAAVGWNAATGLSAGNLVVTEAQTNQNPFLGTWSGTGQDSGVTFSFSATTWTLTDQGGSNNGTYTWLDNTAQLSGDATGTATISGSTLTIVFTNWNNLTLTFSR